jgi:hypothetical protein
MHGISEKRSRSCIDHTWEQGPLYLSMQHHGLFSPIPCMRTGTTLSVYTTTWSLLTNPIHENRKRPWCCIDRYNGHWSHVWDWWEETMVLDRQIEWSLVSCMWLVRRDHDVVSIQYMRTGATLSVYNTMVSSHQLYSWDNGPLYAYTTPWSLPTNPIHENREAPGLMYVIREKRPWCCIDR